MSTLAHAITVACLTTATAGHYTHDLESASLVGARSSAPVDATAPATPATSEPRSPSVAPGETGPDGVNGPTEGGAPPPTPTDIPATEAPTTATTAPDAAAPAAPSAIPADLLGSSQSEESERRPPPRRQPTTVQVPGEDEADVARRYYRELYRPAENPLTVGTTVRGVFTMLEGSIEGATGRIGGASAELWLRWNFIGVGLSGTVLGGRVPLGVDSGRETQVLGGGGPSLSLGRLALIGRGFIDLQLGYDVLAGPVRATPDTPDTDAVTAVPHGPRVRIDFGLISPSRRRARAHHGFGVHVGYQRIVGDLGGGGFPSANMLSVGLGYFGV